MVVTVYTRADGRATCTVSDDEVKRISGLGYNPATEARYITPEDGERVRSRVNRHDYALKETIGKLSARI